jgi:RNA polymerase sigma-70 factor, ECF subfamily
MCDSLAVGGAGAVDPGHDDSCRSFERDVLPLAGALHRHALAYTRNRADAEDLVQDTLLRAFKAFDRVSDNTHFKAWLLTIMRNAWITTHGAAVHRPAERLVPGVAEHPTAAALAEDSSSAEHLALRNVIDTDVRRAVLGLSEEMRRTVYFVAVEGMNCREVAEVMGVSQGTVLSRLHCCRRYLRRSLAEIARRRVLLDETARRAAGLSAVATEVTPELVRRSS